MDFSSVKSRSLRSPQPFSRRPRYDYYEEYQHERLRREEIHRHDDDKQQQLHKAAQRERHGQQAIEERRVVYVGRLRPDSTHSELKTRFEVFGEIEECAVNLRDDGCDASAALRLGHTLHRAGETRLQLCTHTYTDLDSHSDDFDPASTKSKYDCMDFDSLLREAQISLRR
ncbi:peroxisome proliferator-activated receptor gamma coactivator 1-alpha [Clupea harengus]|uniref:Peroxisome proliferator-activated receptor gamma coactivator 1-alpha n=1 Tax=Clupea harengus TaxID=7950 RepID=A0A6P8GQJ0_CLUHA|nr:peroxisome proliferator-activated receptor gamma coactivator 1-alpha [Clupea harengus]